MPKLRATDLDRDRFYMYYINTYIERDIKDLEQVGKLNEFYYYRDIDKKEIDLLIVEGDKLYPIEIKKSKEPAKPDKNFGVLQQFKAANVTVLRSAAFSLMKLPMAAMLPT